MTEKVEEFLKERTKFLSLLNQDIVRNEALHEDFKKDLRSLEKTKENIQELSKQPQHSALIPLCKRLFMQGTIMHTGEYLVSKRAYPNSFITLKTIQQTVNDIEARIKQQRDLLGKTELAVVQLTDRKKLLLGEKDEDIVSEQTFAKDDDFETSVEVALMPNEIRSEKGIAVKLGKFYEIFEYEKE
ncbi:hypothetical protein ABEB36_014338 [Hypothenemus hampei]|uniref:Uncharacterized protein n=1 Tax=Hypothenemus hampei TaxID=57062 RepID=A0ABD1E535_HYPHA